MPDVIAKLADNLDVLGKLSRGDMLAKAGDDGKFVRKTNLLTQALKKSKTHDQELFDQIQKVLTAAEATIEVDLDGNDDLKNRYVKANKGLETLLSTYRSKGSKEFGLIDQLDVLLKEHAANFEEHKKGAGSRGQDLFAIGQRAVKYVKDCRIRSVNNALLIHGLGHSSRYFGFHTDVHLLNLLVRTEDGIVKGRGGQRVKSEELRKAVLDIMRRPGHRKDKRTQLKEKLNEMLGAHGREYSMHDLLTLAEDDYKVLNRRGKENYFARVMAKPGETAFQRTAAEERIIGARNAIRMRFGNCHEKACVAATWLSENTIGGNVGILRAGGTNYDHAWVMVSRDAEKMKSCFRSLSNRKADFPRDTVVVDGWTLDCWGLRDWFNPACNARQLYVRQKIRGCVKNDECGLPELVEWPPPAGFANFRLRFAHMADWSCTMSAFNFQKDFVRNAVFQYHRFSGVPEQILFSETEELLSGAPGRPKSI
jgi:hypothetical protein